MTTPFTATTASTWLHVKPKPPFILLPLYIYPGEDAWAPLFDAARKLPNLSFVVVINPANGPGESNRPDSNYLHALRTLVTFPNLTILGYVRCSWGERDLESIAGDVRKYYGWEMEVQDDMVSTWLPTI